jgi:hypothetical protein
MENIRQIRFFIKIGVVYITLGFLIFALITDDVLYIYG